MKRILTIQDISCVGKCSLTVALPIISAMGIETAVIPTAMLSTHTAFSGFTFLDLTDQIEKITEHWKTEKLAFDAMYTGYLGSFEQLEIVSGVLKDFKTGANIIFVDPVMGDNGKLYPGFDMEFAKSMAEFCSGADVIVPNMTEACCMLGIPYPGEKYTEADVQEILKRLSLLGCPKAVLTGISFKEDELGVEAYDAEQDKFFSYFQKKVPARFHGTGDIFASCCVGALMRGFGFEKALKIAVDYTVECIKLTLKDENHNWYGVDFESAIPYLIKLLGD